MMTDPNLLGKLMLLVGKSRDEALLFSKTGVDMMDTGIKIKHMEGDDSFYMMAATTRDNFKMACTMAMGYLLTLKVQNTRVFGSRGYSQEKGMRSGKTVQISKESL
jgi:hypothetical protein